MCAPCLSSKKALLHPLTYSADIGVVTHAVVKATPLVGNTEDMWDPRTAPGRLPTKSKPVYTTVITGFLSLTSECNSN